MTSFQKNFTLLDSEKGNRGFATGGGGGGWEGHNVPQKSLVGIEVTSGRAGWLSAAVVGLILNEIYLDMDYPVSVSKILNQQQLYTRTSSSTMRKTTKSLIKTSIQTNWVLLSMYDTPVGNGSST